MCVCWHELHRSLHGAGFPQSQLYGVHACVLACARRRGPVTVKCTPAVVQEPTIFSKFTSCIVASGNPILLSRFHQKPLSLTSKLSLPSSSASTPQACAKRDCNAGFTIAHDVSARDWQLKRNGGQWLLGKTMDSFAPFGSRHRYA